MQTINTGAFTSSGIGHFEMKSRYTYEIKSNAFNGCNYLYSFTVPNDIYRIYSGAFYTTALKSVKFLGNVSVIDNGAFRENVDVFFVPYNYLQQYKTKTNMTQYANKIYPIGGQYSETVTIADTDWTLNSTTNLYEATATVVSATNESRNILDWSLVDSSGNQIEDTYGLGASAQGSMSITFTAQTAPTDTIYISVQSTLTNYKE